jgi:hypothetical protein
VNCRVSLSAVACVIVCVCVCATAPPLLLFGGFSNLVPFGLPSLFELMLVHHLSSFFEDAAHEQAIVVLVVQIPARNALFLVLAEAVVHPTDVGR